MNHHLEHAISVNTRELFEDGRESAWQAVRFRVESALANDALLAAWDEVFAFVNSCDAENTDLDAEIKTRVMPASDSYVRNRHDYGARDRHGNPCWVDGMASATRRMIPHYSDRVCLGSVLAGIDTRSVAGARAHFDEFRREMADRLGRQLAGFHRDNTRVIEQDPDIAFTDYRVQWWLDDLKKLNQTLRQLNGPEYDLLPIAPERRAELEKTEVVRNIPSVNPLLKAMTALSQAAETQPNTPIKDHPAFYGFIRQYQAFTDGLLLDSPSRRPTADASSPSP